MLKNFFESIAGRKQRQRLQRDFLKRHPLGRFGQGEDIAHAALYLASAESSFITGVDLVVDGGSSL
jgi:NAD(P)-dependent dehydrogenase (short-subunit alcohol dehydrogenase family)